MNPRPPVECRIARCSKTATRRRSISKIAKNSFQNVCEPGLSSRSCCHRVTKTVARSRISCQDGAGTGGFASQVARSTSRAYGLHATRTLDCCVRRRVVVCHHARVGSPDYSWPTDLPDSCPPSEAMPSTGLYYRLLRSNPATSKDYIRPRDSRKHRDLTGDDLCKASAFSVYADVEDARRVRETSPGFTHRIVAQGELKPEMGVLHPTPTATTESHASWWVALGQDPLPVFVALDES